MIPVHHVRLARLCAEAYRAPEYKVSNLDMVRSLHEFACDGTDSVRDIGTDVLGLVPGYSYRLGWYPIWWYRKGKHVARQIKTAIIRHDLNPSMVRLAGHSLGGAVMVCAAAELAQQFIKVKEVVTFGAPPTGRMRILDDVEITQYENGNDIVDNAHFLRQTRRSTNIGSPEGYDHGLASYIQELENLVNGA